LVVALNQRLSSLPNIARAPEGRTRGEQNADEEPGWKIYQPHDYLPFQLYWISLPPLNWQTSNLPSLAPAKDLPTSALNQDREK